MNLLFAGICLLFAGSQGQLISMKVCSDDVCSKDCISWSVESGRCSPCLSNLGPCSVKNPSSIVTTSSITLYSDATCQQKVPGAGNMQLLMDKGCNVLIGDYSSRFGSYNASNVSAIVGGVLAGTFLLTCICICSCCLCKRCQAKQPIQDPVPPVNTNTYNPPVPYLTHVNYSSPPTIQQPYYSTPYAPNYTQQQPYYPTYYPQYVQAPPSAAPQSAAPPPSAPSATPPTYYHDYPSKSAI